MSAALKLVSEDKAPPDAELEKRMSALEELLALEGELRNCPSVAALQHLAVNRLRSTLDVQQVFLLVPDFLRKAAFCISKVSGISAVDPNAPAVIALSRLFSHNLALCDGGAAKPFVLDDTGGVTPFRHGVGMRLLRNDVCLGGLVVLHDHPLAPQQMQVLHRLAGVLSHAWFALMPKRAGVLRRLLNRRVLLVPLVLAVAGLAIPVPLSTLAPVEVIADDPWIVAAPIDGVVEAVAIEPNSVVSAGEVLFRYVDTDLAARAAIASRNQDVATARLQTINQTAFSSASGRRDLAGAKAELALARAENEYALSLLKMSVVAAPVAGLAVFDRRSTWQGRPVATGEAVMEIADPRRVAYRVDLPVGDSIVLKPGAEVKLFLDANPLAPRKGQVVQAAYRARPTPDGALAYRVIVKGDEAKPPRIGSRGTAQIFGDDVSLGFYLFRRPITAIRQWLGV